MKETNCIELNELDEYLKKNLKPSRYRHSMGVVKMAVSLAEIYGANREKARRAAMAHDIAKCLTLEESNRLVRYYGLPFKYLGNPAIAHSKLGVQILQSEFHWRDEEVLSAVSYHTTGKAAMTLLEEIIYVSDAIEEGRDYEDAPRLRRLAAENLDEACREVLEFSIDSLKSQGRKIDSDTIEAYTYIKNKIQDSKEN
ncbi:MAG: bis(5'-nucleosyl)-tetraphosphatase (symmetrical) YqeK [Eubacteriales bacterium]|nr:bis(5'-nucleosyl)-tetraphosphatase (symmetrical) YqeK [Eubacteriales bacterium]